MTRGGLARASCGETSLTRPSPSRSVAASFAHKSNVGGVCSSKLFFVASSACRPMILARLVAVCTVAVFVGGGFSAVPAQAQVTPVPTVSATADSAAPAASVTPQPNTIISTPGPTLGAPSAGAPGAAPATARGDVVVVRGVPVTKVKVAKNGRTVSARVLWNQAMIARKGKGHRDRFNIRLVAFPTGGGTPVVLYRWSKPKPKAKNQQVNIGLSKKRAKVLLAAADAVLSVSQQYAAPNRKLFGRNYVTVKHLNRNAGKAKAKGAMLAGRSSRAGGLADCWEQEIVPGVDRSYCDQSAADLRCANLSNIDFSFAVLTSTVLECANMSGANVTGAISGGIEGQPNPPPTGWNVVNGVFVPATPPGPQPQTITFTSSAPVATVGGGTYTPTATATSGLVVAFTIDVSSSSGCTISAGVVSFGAPAGSCVINANQAGNTNYAAATQVQQTVTVALSCAGGGPCVVGDTGPGGGKIFYVDMSRTAGSQNFEAAPDGWNTGADPTAEWGCFGTNISGAAATGIGTGEANTTAIVHLTTGCSTAGIAAKLADGYAGGSQTDWFLPSKDELNQLCKYAWGYTSGGVAITGGQSVAPAQQAIVCSTASPNALQGGFAADDYWSSSQRDANLAWSRSFGGGYQLLDIKDSTLPVRPVRAF